MSDKILDRVRKMLNLANHPNTSPEERETFLAKVDELMVKHAIDEALLAATQPASQRRVPVAETVTLYQKGTHHERFRTILAEVCRTTRVRFVELRTEGRDQNVKLVGFRDDVDYTQLLFTTIQYAFIAKIQPTWNPELPLGANIYAFKEAGYDWTSIYATARRNGVECDQDRETLWSPYDTYVRKNGLTKIKTNRFGAYRESYSDAFVERICARLEEMREAGAKQAASSGAELVLAHSAEEVDEEFYRLFPHRRPLTEAQLEAMRREQEEAARLEREKHAAWLASLTPAERARYEKEKQEERRRRARLNAQYWRQLDKEEAARYDSAGRRAGSRAADSVNLNRPGPAAGSAKRTPLT